MVLPRTDTLHVRFTRVRCSHAQRDINNFTFRYSIQNARYDHTIPAENCPRILPHRYCSRASTRTLRPPRTTTHARPPIHFSDCELPQIHSTTFHNSLHDHTSISPYLHVSHVSHSLVLAPNEHTQSCPAKSSGLLLAADLLSRRREPS